MLDGALAGFTSIDMIYYIIISICLFRLVPSGFILFDPVSFRHSNAQTRSPLRASDPSLEPW